ncbi:MAG: cupin domain-containing protein [Vicinamibacterales bacterium]
MKRPLVFLAALALTGAVGAAQSPPHTIVQLDDLKWGAGNRGVTTTIAEGNPREAGPFTMMLKLADGAFIPPHFHNVDKRLVVVKGELLMGHGDAIDVESTTAVPVGGVAVVRANTHHYEGGRGETIVALIANGPFTTTMLTR